MSKRRPDDLKDEKQQTNETLDSKQKRMKQSEQFVNVKPFLIQNQETKLLIYGPELMVQLYNKTTNKRIYLFGDFHHNHRPCELNSKYYTFMQFVEGVLDLEKDKTIDLFVESGFPHFSTQTPSIDKGQLFHALIPQLNLRHCLEKNKTDCQTYYPNLRVHAIDNRRSIHEWEAIYQFIDETWMQLIKKDLPSAIKSNTTSTLLPRIAKGASFFRKFVVLPEYEKWKRKSTFEPKIRSLLEQYMMREARYRHNFRRNLKDLEQIPLFTWEQPIASLEQTWDSYRTVSMQIINDVLALQLEKEKNEVLKTNLLAKIAIFIPIQHLISSYFIVTAIDVYTIERYLKPYVLNCISYMGSYHIDRQVDALKLFGFEVVSRLPANHKLQLYFNDALIVLPQDVTQAQLVELTDFSVNDPDNYYAMLCEKTDKSRFVLKANQFRFAKANLVDQCLLYHFSVPLFPKQAVSKAIIVPELF